MADPQQPDYDALAKAHGGVDYDALAAKVQAGESKPDNVDTSLWDDFKQAMGETSLVGVARRVLGASKADWNAGADELPSVGGAAGGVVGGAYGGPLGAFGGASVGGAAGALARQAIRRATGADPDTTAPPDLKNAATEGATQGALELGGTLAQGAARGLGHGLMDVAIAPSLKAARKFGDVASTAIAERLPVGRMVPRSVIEALPDAVQRLLPDSLNMAGSEQAKAAMNASAQALRQRLDRFGMMGLRFDSSDMVAGDVADLLTKMAKQGTGDAEEKKVADLVDEFLRRHPGPLTPTNLKDIKQAAQEVAQPLYEAQQRGEYIGAEGRAETRFQGALAGNAKTALETIPGVAENEARTQGLIGATKAISDAELKHINRLTEAALFGTSVAAGAMGGRGNPDEGLSDEIRRGAKTWLVARGLMSPRIASRTALALTAPQMQALFRQFPRLAYAVMQSGSDEGQ